MRQCLKKHLTRVRANSTRHLADCLPPHGLETLRNDAQWATSSERRKTLRLSEGVDEMIYVANLV